MFLYVGRIEKSLSHAEEITMRSEGRVGFVTGVRYDYT